MENKESVGVTVSNRELYHRELMLVVLKALQDTPLVLKGGTALYLAYGLDRFSEDLDFDSHKKLNLTSKLSNLYQHSVTVTTINLKKDTDTVSRYMLHYRTKDGIEDRLKVEISYRNPLPQNRVSVIDGIKYASVDYLIESKLNAANNRVAARDLYDLHFLSEKYPNHFTPLLSQELYAFAKSPDKLLQTYLQSAEEDPLLRQKDFVEIALRLNINAERLVIENPIDREIDLER